MKTIGQQTTPTQIDTEEVPVTRSMIERTASTRAITATKVCSRMKFLGFRGVIRTAQPIGVVSLAARSRSRRRRAIQIDEAWDLIGRTVSTVSLTEAADRTVSALLAKACAS